MPKLWQICLFFYIEEELLWSWEQDFCTPVLTLISSSLPSLFRSERIFTTESASFCAWFLKRKLQGAHIAILGQMVVPFCAASSITASKLFRLLNAIGQNPYFVVIFWLWCYNLIMKHHPLESHCIVILGGQRSMNWVDLFNVYQVQTQWDAIKSSSVGGQKKVINAPPLPSLCGWWVGLGLFLVFVPKKPKI